MKARISLPSRSFWFGLFVLAGLEVARAAEDKPLLQSEAKAARVGGSAAFDPQGGWVDFRRSGAWAQWTPAEVPEGWVKVELKVASGGPIAGQGGTLEVLVGAGGKMVQSLPVEISAKADPGAFATRTTPPFRWPGGPLTLRLSAKATHGTNIALLRGISVQATEAPAETKPPAPAKKETDPPWSPPGKPRVKPLPPTVDDPFGPKRGGDPMPEVKPTPKLPETVEDPFKPTDPAERRGIDDGFATTDNFTRYTKLERDKKWWDADNMDFLDGKMRMRLRLACVDAADDVKTYGPGYWSTAERRIGMTMEEFTAAGTEAKEYVATVFAQGSPVVYINGERSSGSGQPLGHVVIGKVLLAEDLIEKGFGILHEPLVLPPAEVRPGCTPETWRAHLQDLETKAREAKRGLWKYQSVRDHVKASEAAP